MWTLEGFRFPASLVPRLTSAATSETLTRATSSVLDSAVLMYWARDRSAEHLACLSRTRSIARRLGGSRIVGCVSSRGKSCGNEVLRHSPRTQTEPRLSQGCVLLRHSERELYGSFASDEQARYIQATGLDVHGFVELQLEGFGTGSR